MRLFRFFNLISYIFLLVSFALVVGGNKGEDRANLCSKALRRKNVPSSTLYGKVPRGGNRYGVLIKEKKSLDKLPDECKDVPVIATIANSRNLQFANGDDYNEVMDCMNDDSDKFQGCYLKGVECKPNVGGKNCTMHIEDRPAFQKGDMTNDEPPSHFIVNNTMIEQNQQHQEL